MRRPALILALLLAGLPHGTAADTAPATAAGPAEVTVVALRPIRARAVIGPGDVALEARRVPGAVADMETVLGMEARGVIHTGRPIMPEDIAPPALVERNAFVTLVYRNGMLTISAEGRALARGGAGERVRVMNLDSRATVTGTVIGAGTVEVR